MVVFWFLLGLLFLGCSDGVYVHTVQTIHDFGQCKDKDTVQTIHNLGQAGKDQALAFTALLSKVTTLGSKGVVKYDTVLTNVGGAYVPSTGVLTAPHKGIYTISCSLMSNPVNAVHLNIMKNGNALSTLYSASGTYPLAAQTLQLLLEKGDKIWIQNQNTQTAKLHDHNAYNVFSGALITRM
ncbi:complement C1q-like protein 4 isoform X1 [Crassostrea angulata]|uniref:complement C1q-like protein 4 isoform X1 n=1 Tax=Magallana angulata TaxID=2784310 RepID=UPI0022B09C53|nr:complement C1q-like protein 4 isoform X1 [Crassostrea angulata]XP_052678076.1 complement C1q-like protein 4 isoform X1 [Crassostrea angulata]